MTRLAIIGVPRTAEVLLEAIAQARLRGMAVALLDRPAAVERCAAPACVQRIALDCDDAEAAVAELRGFDPQLVVSFSEFHLLLAAEIRERLGLPGASADAVRRTRCKYATRQRLDERGLTRAAFARTTLADLDATLAQFAPPYIIKPASMTGSIGVHAVRNRADVAAFRDRFVSWEAEAARGRAFVVESFIAGDEYSVEGICHRGGFHLIAVTAKHTDGHPNFAETGHMLPARARDADFAGFVGQVTEALGLDATPVHAEVKVDGARIELIEIHARFGGDLIPLLIANALGYDVFGALYDALLGIAPPAPAPARAVAGVHFFRAEELAALAGRLRQRPDADFRLTVHAADGHGAERAADNIRILNPRAGHLLFTANSHDAAEAIFDALGAGAPAAVRSA